jgi:hypothetical protein
VQEVAEAGDQVHLNQSPVAGLLPVACGQALEEARSRRDPQLMGAPMAGEKVETWSCGLASA